MSAAARPALTPLSQQGAEYWNELVLECQRQMEQINSVVSRKGVTKDDLVQWDAGLSVHMQRAQYPSTDIELQLHFERWGPAICGRITGFQAEDLQFASEEFEFTVAKDLDGQAVAVYEEGRSLSAKELAAYLTQKFQRCFPTLSLPCNTWERTLPRAAPR